MCKLVLVVGLAAVLVLAGCSSGTSDTEADVKVNSTEDLIELMRDSVQFEYEPYATPKAMLDGVDVALVGDVVSVDSALQELEEGPPIGAVVVGLEPREIWKDDPSRSGDVVFYWFSRPTNLDISLYRKGLPVGTEVVLFGQDATGRVTFAEGDPGTTMYDPWPQGLFIPAGENRLVNVWAEDIASSDWPEISNVEDLRAALGLSP